MRNVKIIIIVSTVLISFCSFYPLRLNCSLPIVEGKTEANYNIQQEGRPSWHTVEVWSFGIIPFFVFAIRSIDYFAYLCDEDEDVKEAKVKYFSWVCNRTKEFLHRILRTTVRLKRPQD
jgi:hypothetical protein